MYKNKEVVHTVCMDELGGVGLSFKHSEWKREVLNEVFKQCEL